MLRLLYVMTYDIRYTVATLLEYLSAVVDLCTMWLELYALFCGLCCVGIQYLRDYLHLPQEIVPATLKRPIRAETARPPRPKGQGSHDTQHNWYSVATHETISSVSKYSNSASEHAASIRNKVCKWLTKKEACLPQIVCHWSIHRIESNPSH